MGAFRAKGRGLIQNMRWTVGEETFKTYSYIARRFLKFVGKCEYLDRQKVLDFLDYLQNRGCKGTYLQLVFTALKKLYVSSGLYWPFKKGETPKRNPPSRPYMEEGEMRRMLSILKRKVPEDDGRFRLMRLRDYAMSRLAAIVGLRRNEIRAMNLDDFQPPQVYVRTSKGGSTRWRTLDNETVRAVKRYMKLRGSDGCPALFVSSWRRRLCPSSMTYISQRSRRWAGIQKRGAGWHSIRRGWCTWLNERGMSETELTVLGGWRDAQQVHEYIQTVPRKLERKVARVHPLWR